MKRLLYIIKQTAFTIFSFCFFLLMALYLSVCGFILITIGGASPKNKHKYHLLLQKVATYVINHVPGTTFSYSNVSKESFETPSVIISNHQSHLDLMAIMMLTPNLIILTKNWVWHNPFYGIIIRYADFFPVTETENMISSIEKKVKMGYSVMVFPEGTRSPDCHIQRFHRGAFYIAERLNLDIIPVFIEGFGKVLPKESFHLHPGNMRVDVMDRIRRNDPNWAYDYRTMTKKLHRIYLDKINEEVCCNR